MMMEAWQRVLETNVGFGTYMRLRWGGHSRPLPGCRPTNSTLKSADEVQQAVEETCRLRLPPCSDQAKTWDTIGALYEIVSRFPPSAAILDAGAEMYSRLLPWLYLYGFRSLIGVNLVFSKSTRNGPIRYEPGDITATKFPDARFDAITCLSVIEHGVGLSQYFNEMARILKPGGLLVTSTDYYEHPTVTDGKMAYGVPIRIFTRKDIEEAFAVAARAGLELTGPVDLSSKDRVVHWKEHGLRYSFVTFSMTRTHSPYRR